jgi:sulfate adenylyltransferase
MIQPHGGQLINKIASDEEKEEVLAKIKSYKKVVLDIEKIKDVKNIAFGAYSPLQGFLKKEDTESVLSGMKLKNGVVWPIPVVLDVSEDKKNEIKNEKEILCLSKEGEAIALLKDIEIYPYDKDFFAERVFGTKDKNHPGVNEIYNGGDFLIGGEILLLDKKKDYFPQYNFTPFETREIFQKRNWERIVAFQTRNVPHRGHEFLQKEALKETDGLFVQPVIGKKKTGDFKDEYILLSYEILIHKFYPKEKTFLGILPLKMRYAGPREAVFHALIRKNFGCTHFIVGRDHAGVGGYYPPFAAQDIFDEFKNDEIGINILKYPEVVYHPEKKTHIFKGQAPSDKIISFSGTKLREAIKNKETPSDYIIRPAVYNFLAQSENALVDENYQKKDNRKGFVLWFTGFSQAGKTTIANGVYNVLKERGLSVERLDGDIVRKTISSDLGFSKEDRNENIRRIGLVSALLSQNGIGVVTSFISPYRKERDKVRTSAKNFIEIFCNCPLEVCETRDTKGLYKLARKGEIENFTGVSDPYEIPLNPEIILKTDKETIDECVGKVINYLQQTGIL